MARRITLSPSSLQFAAARDRGAVGLWRTAQTEQDECQARIKRGEVIDAYALSSIARQRFTFSSLHHNTERGESLG